LSTVARLQRELRGRSEEENRKAWSEVKAYLDRLANHIYRTKPAVWFRRYGIHTDEPDYPELIFFDTIHGGTVAKKHGVHRCLALAGMYAHNRGDMKGAGRAILLLDRHTVARRALQARENATKPRRRSRKLSDGHIRALAQRFLSSGTPVRYLISAIQRELSTQGHDVSKPTIRAYLRRLNLIDKK
jgi:hypothetical protein